LVAAGDDVDELDALGMRPLHWAAGEVQAETLRVIVVELGADKAAQAADGGTALHVAACYGHVEAIRVLVEELLH
jgi:ankyrin repeat protein